MIELVINLVFYSCAFFFPFLVFFIWENKKQIDPDVEYLYSKEKKLYKIYLSSFSAIGLLVLAGASFLLVTLIESNTLGVNLKLYAKVLGYAWVMFSVAFAVENAVNKFNIIKKHIDDK